MADVSCVVGVVGWGLVHLLPGAAGVGVVGQADCAGGWGAWKWPCCGWWLAWLVGGVWFAIFPIRSHIISDTSGSVSDTLRYAMKV